MERVLGDGSIATIEGNTDSPSGHTGGRVMRKLRRTGIAGYGYPPTARTPLRPLDHSGRYQRIHRQSRQYGSFA